MVFAVVTTGDSLISIKHNALLPNELTVLFNDQPLKELGRATLTVWNPGRQTISDADVRLPLTFLFEMKPSDTTDALAKRILKAEVIAQSRQANGAKVSLIMNENKLIITFSYLDHQQGFKIAVLYAGIITQRPEIICDIQGMPQGIERGLTIRPHRIVRLVGYSITFMNLLVFLSMFLGLFSVRIIDYGSNHEYFVIAIITGTIGVIYSSIVLGLSRPNVFFDRIFGKRIPPELLDSISAAPSNKSEK